MLSLVPCPGAAPPSCLLRRLGSLSLPTSPASPPAQAHGSLPSTRLGCRARLRLRPRPQDGCHPSPHPTLPGSLAVRSNKARLCACPSSEGKASSLTHVEAPSAGYLRRVSHIWDPPLPAPEAAGELRPGPQLSLARLSSALFSCSPLVCGPLSQPRAFHRNGGSS
jgi:hypothetical protein